MVPAVEDGLSICMAAWYLFSIVAYTIALIWCIIRVDWRATLHWTWVRNQSSRALAWCQAVLPASEGSGENPIDEAMDDLIQQRKREFLRRGCLCMAPLMAVGLVFRAAGLFGFEQVPHPRESYVNAAATVPAMAALCVFFENQPGKGAMVVGHVIAFGSMYLKLWYSDNGVQMMHDWATGITMRLLLAVTICDIRLTVMCNTVYAALSAAMFNELVSNGDDVAQIGFRKHVHLELFVLLELVVVHYSLLRRLESEARGTIEAKMSSNFISGLKRLLRTNYDVVAELDQELAFSDHAQELASVLLHGPHRSLKESRITDLMPYDADKAAFTTHVQQPSPEIEPLCCVIPHIFHMRDSDGNVLSMEMWHTRFEDLDSRLRHLIGIKELANHEPQASQQEEPSMSTTMQVTDTDRGHAGRGRRRRSRSSVEVSDSEQPRQGHISEQTWQQHAHQGQTQPQNPADRMQKGEDSDGSSASSTPSARSHRYLVEGLRRTSAEAQKASLLHALTAWNVARRSAGCCPYHDLIREAIRTTKWLASARCIQDYAVRLPAEIWQCPNCGILAPSAATACYDPLTCTCYYCQRNHTAACRLVEI